MDIFSTGHALDGAIFRQFSNILCTGRKYICLKSGRIKNVCRRYVRLKNVGAPIGRSRPAQPFCASGHYPFVPNCWCVQTLSLFLLHTYAHNHGINIVKPFYLYFANTRARFWIVYHLISLQLTNWDYHWLIIFVNNVNQVSKSRRH